MDKGDGSQGNAMNNYMQQAPPQAYPAPYGYVNPVMTQPQPQQQQQQMNNQVNITLNTAGATSEAEKIRNWSSGLCGCCDDIESCLCVLFCGSCYTCCVISERMGEGCFTPLCFYCACPELGMLLPMLVFRTKLRAKYNIHGSAVNDFCCSLCCGELVACQIKRELDAIERSTGRLPFT